MDLRRVPVDKLKADPHNARAHSPRNLEVIRNSLERFGQAEPLVVQKGTGRVIGGNARLEVLKQMGVVEVDVVEADVDDAAARLLAVTLNRTAELATWDLEALKNVLDGTDNTLAADLGWAAAEIETLEVASSVPPFEPLAADTQAPLDRKKPIKCPACGHEFTP